MNKQKHLTLDSRILIESKLNEGQSFKAIGRFLNKDCTTISKEVKLHLSFEKSGAYGKSFNDCLLAFQRKCSAQKVCPECASRNNRFCWSCGKCSSSCILYEKYVCPKLSKPLMSVMAARNAINAPWKSGCTGLLMPKKNTKRSEVNPEPDLPSPQWNLNRWMTLFLLF